MLTPGEQAAAAYNVALASGRRRVLGVDDMVIVTEERLSNVRRAKRAIVAARGSERHFPREPDDARLEQMLSCVSELVETLEGDHTRWAAS